MSSYIVKKNNIGSAAREDVWNRQTHIGRHPVTFITNIPVVAMLISAY